MTTINKKQTEALIRRAIRERGDDAKGEVPGSTWGACAYRHRGKPLCIVGQVVSYLTDKPLAKVFPGAENDATWDRVSDKVQQRIGVTFTEGAHNLLFDAQMEQDSGKTWGEVRKAVL